MRLSMLCLVCAVVPSIAISAEQPETMPNAANPPVIAAHGTWEGSVPAARLAEGAVAMSDLRVAEGQAYWRESRPAEGGRLVLMTRTADGQLRTLSGPEHNVRTRVHEYGGASYLRIGAATLFVNFSDQRVYWHPDGAAPVALTPAGYQYADCVHDAVRKRVICVREDHTAATKAENGEERNEIVALALPEGDGVPEPTAGQVLVTGSDFVAAPRLSPDAGQLAWIQWNHPNMPWDQTELRLAEVLADGALGTPQRVAGGAGQSVIEPEWDRDGTLYFLNDPSGWWNLYRWREGKLSAVAPMARELGGPLWSVGQASYALLGDGRAVIRHSHLGVDRLGVLDLGNGQRRDFDLPYQHFAIVRALDAGRVLSIAAASDRESALIAIDLDTGSHSIWHQPVPDSLPAESLSLPQAIEFPTAAGADGVARTAHAFFYPPRNPRYRAPEGELPPLLVLIHGGPTAVARPLLSLARQFWTSRGFALVDVNYGGSTTFGRAYRERLNGQWGVVDVQDAAAAVDYLVAQGLVDPRRIAIRGGSAGGFTTLASLAFTDRYNAGANSFGVSDIKALAATSHKFERQYDVSLVGPPDEALYRSRSPLYHLDGFKEPLITFQGDEDKIVPPSQSRMIVEALDRRGVPHAYLEFAGEQHGFRKAENIIRVHEAELYFYGRVFGFTPADAIEPVPIKHLDR